MKTLIFALSLLFSASAMSKEAPPQEQLDYIHEQILVGIEMDIMPYLMWLQVTYNQGPDVPNMLVAMKAGTCFMLWSEIASWNTDLGILEPEDFDASAERAYRAIEVYVIKAGGDPSRIQSHLLPALLRDGYGRMSSGNIVECTILDGALLQDTMMDLEKYLPQVPDESEPKSGGIAS